MSKWLLRGIILSWLFFFALVMVNGTFSRIINDDYCILVVGNELSAWEGLIYWYNSWTGRYSEVFVKSLVAPLELNLIQVLPALFVITFGASLAFALDQICHVLQLQANRLFVFASTCMILFALLNSVPNVQLLYWFSAIIPYSLPLISLTLMTGLLLWSTREANARHHQILLMMILPILAFITSGFTEVTATFQLSYWVIVAFGVFIFLPNHRRQLLPLISTLIIASIIALIFIVIAPGNEIRQNRVFEIQERTEQFSLVDIISTTFNTTLTYYTFTYNIAHNLYVLFLTVVGIIAWIPSERIQKLPRLRYPLRWAIGLFIVITTLIASTIVPIVYARGEVVMRILLLARYLQLLLGIGLGIVISIYLVQNNILAPIRRRPIYRITTYAILSMGIYLPIVGIIFHGGLYTRFSTYAIEWDARHQLIIDTVAQNETRFEVPLLSYYMDEDFLLGNIETDGYAFNTCQLDLYGAESITVVDDF